MINVDSFLKKGKQHFICEDIILNIEDSLVRSKWCYKYCDHIIDDIEMMKGITHPYWAESYFMNIRED